MGEINNPEIFTLFFLIIPAWFSFLLGVLIGGVVS